jgi:hypothetical protein
MATIEGWAPFLCDLGVSQIFVAQGEEERQKEAEQQAQEVEGGKGRCKHEAQLKIVNQPSGDTGEDAVDVFAAAGVARAWDGF